MSDPHTVKLAELLANDCVAIQPGDNVLLRGSVIHRDMICDMWNGEEILIDDDLFCRSRKSMT